MIKITCSLLVFIYSLYVGQFATEGDQATYRAIYEKIGKLSFNEAAVFYFHSINAKEIVHFVFSFIFSNAPYKIFSDVVFLPCCIKLFENLDIITSLYLGSGINSLFTALRLLDILNPLLRSLRTILGTTLTSI